MQFEKVQYIQWEKTRCITNLFFFGFYKKNMLQQFLSNMMHLATPAVSEFLFTVSVILLIYSIWKWCMMLSRILYAFLKSRLVLNMLRKKNHCSYFFSHRLYFHTTNILTYLVVLWVRLIRFFHIGRYRFTPINSIF